MLEYAIIILPKVSFSRELFRKELTKCINWLGDSELDYFKSWCYDNFQDMYPDILAEVFKRELVS